MPSLSVTGLIIAMPFHLLDWLAICGDIPSYFGKFRFLRLCLVLLVPAPEIQETKCSACLVSPPLVTVLIA